MFDFYSLPFLCFLSSYSAYGSYCLKDNEVPFCPKDENSFGDPRCCVGNQPTTGYEDISLRNSNSIETMVDAVKQREKS